MLNKKPFSSFTFKKIKVYIFNTDISSYNLRKEAGDVIFNHNISESQFYSWRSVSFNRLPLIVENGIDVQPSDSPIYVDGPGPEKAMEYGGDKIALMGFDPDKLDRTFREVDSDIDLKELGDLKEKFPNVEYSKDRSRIWLSRLALDDPRGHSYEVEYGAWLPGDPFEALKELWLIGDIQESDLNMF